jgi:hypothetical protein
MIHRSALLVVCAALFSGCWRYSPKDETAPPDSEPGGETATETAPPVETDPPVETGDSWVLPEDLFGAALYGVIMVPDGTRIEETFGDKTTWGEGYSDAYEGPTAEIWQDIRAELYPQGAIAKPAYATGITITLPGHVDMALGKRTPHGHHPATANLPGLYRPELPTIWELLREQDDSVPADKVGFTGNTVHMQAINYSLYPGLGSAMPGTYDFVDDRGGNNPAAQPAEDPPVIERVVEHLQDGWRLQLVNLHQIDRMGHYNPDQHVPDIIEVDDDLTQLWNETIQGDPELRDRTVMVIVSDHGRHRFEETDPPWQHHGDGCSGCREVPMMLLGPGVRQGAEVEGPYVLEDVGATVGWLMGIQTPYATGLIMTEMLEGTPELPQRSGPHALHSSADLLAYQQFRDEAASRSEIVLDGTTFSNPEAIHVEQPKVLRTDPVDYACWREVTVGTDDEFWNWMPVCKRRLRAGDWADLGSAPAPLVWPYWDPALAVDTGGRLHLAWSANDTGGAQTSSGIYLARWTVNRGWEGGETYVEGSFFPVHPSLAIDDEGVAWVAWSAGTSDGEGRYTRHVEVHKVTWPTGATQRWERSLATGYSDAQGRSYEREDDANLTIVDGDVHLAYFAVNSDGTNLLSTKLVDGEGDWSSVHASDDTGRVFIHVRPQWSDDGWLYWARLDAEGEAEVCRAHASAMTDAQCEATGAPYLESLAPMGDGVQITTSTGDRQWSLAQIDF